MHVRAVRPTPLLVMLPVLAALVGGCPEQESAPSQPGATASVLPASNNVVDDGDPGIIEVKTGASPPARELVAHPQDKDGIKKRGILRVLVYGEEHEHLPRAGVAPTSDRELAVAFANRLGVTAELIRVDRFTDLLDLLEQGRGDLVAARMTATKNRQERVLFTRPTAVVSELLVARKGDAAAPKTIAELAGKEITVRASSSYAESLAALGEKLPGGAKPNVVATDEAKDTWEIAADVADGKTPLTVIDSDIFAELASVDDRLASPFAIAEGRSVAWAVRKDQPALKAAADVFLIEAALTNHTEKIFTGDLDGIKQRGVLRVLTRNNGVTYFLHRGMQMGFDYELMKMFATSLGVRLEIIVPPQADQLIPWLLEGQGDVVASEMTKTDERAQVVAFSKPYMHVDQVLIQKKGDAPITDLAALKGKQVHVRKSSSYWRNLEALNAGVELIAVDETSETEDLLHDVSAGMIPLTVADTSIAGIQQGDDDGIQATLVVKQGDEIAFAVRPQSKALLAALDAFVQKSYRGLEYNVLKKKYFEDQRTIAKASVESFGASGAVSPYDELFKKYGAMYGLDWRLLAAQAYQESRFDPKARSWVGAKGLFQVMPATGKEMGFTNLEDPEESVHAGAKYLAKLVDSFDPKIPFKHRVRFALAAYNAGKGHVTDAMRLAGDRGANPNKWFKNVEDTMLALENPKVHRGTRHGYCRGTEPVKYVSEIQSRYDNYVRVVAGP